MTTRQDEEKIIKQLDNGKYLVYLYSEKHWNRKIVDTIAEANKWLDEAARRSSHRRDARDAFENRVSCSPDHRSPGFYGWRK